MNLLKITFVCGGITFLWSISLSLDITGNQAEPREQKTQFLNPLICVALAAHARRSKGGIYR